MNAEQFQIARIQLGVDDTGMARLLGVSYPRIGDWKNGKREIPHYIEASISAHLLLTPEQLAMFKKIRKVDDRGPDRRGRPPKNKSDQLPAAA